MYFLLISLSIVPEILGACVQHPVSKLPHPCSVRNLQLIDFNGRTLGSDYICNGTVYNSQLINPPTVILSPNVTVESQNSTFLFVLIDVTSRKLLWMVGNITANDNELLSPQEHSGIVTLRQYSPPVLDYNKQPHQIDAYVFEIQNRFLLYIRPREVRSFYFIKWLNKQLVNGSYICGPVATGQFTVLDPIRASLPELNNTSPVLTQPVKHISESLNSTTNSTAETYSKIPVENETAPVLPSIQNETTPMLPSISNETASNPSGNNESISPNVLIPPITNFTDIKNGTNFTDVRNDTNFTDIKTDANLTDIRNDTNFTDIKTDAHLTDITTDTNFTDIKTDTNFTDIGNNTNFTDIKNDTNFADIRNDTNSHIKNDTNFIDNRSEINLTVINNNTNFTDIKNDTNFTDIKTDTSFIDIKNDTNLADIKNDRDLIDITIDTNFTDITNDTNFTDITNETNLTDSKNNKNERVSHNQTGSQKGSGTSIHSKGYSMLVLISVWFWGKK